MIYEPDIYRQQMEYQYIIDGEGQSGEMLFVFIIVLIIQHYAGVDLWQTHVFGKKKDDLKMKP